MSPWDIVRVTKGKKPSILMIHAFKANDTHLEESAKQLLF